MSPRLRSILRIAFFAALIASVVLSLKPDSGQGEFFAWIQGDGQKLAFAVLLVSGLALIATSPTAGAPGRLFMAIVFGLGFGLRMVAFVVVQPFQGFSLVVGLSTMLLSVLFVGLKPWPRIFFLMLLSLAACFVGSFAGLGQLVNSDQMSGLVRPPEAELPEGLFGGEEAQGVQSAEATMGVSQNNLCIGDRRVTVDGGAPFYIDFFKPGATSLEGLPRSASLPSIPEGDSVRYSGGATASPEFAPGMVLVFVEYFDGVTLVTGYVNSAHLGDCVAGS